ncbi:MAG: hypothetical protein Q7V62_05075 [Actinomycetota bacterium]|nr:hypothetical protein [Actinomycetota bacterium]
MARGRSSAQHLVRSIALVTIAATLFACTDDPGSTGTYPGLWVLGEPVPGAGAREALIRGTLRYDDENECFQIELADGTRLPIVWWYGTEALLSGDGVVTADGTEIHLGEEVWGGGGYDHADDMLNRDIPAACLPPTGEVAVLG